ncbi:tetratricopeptide repeat-containing protein [Babesia caballi]|uniref:Tetratricopeptide repeat-containing protein n=1 Tax=Babesia caballi TaxID=5871 RepID=A0AAV4LXD4_BABCB|nr:tetratricopeptide repeat-containing protein [Babesia caballi]
MQQKALADLEKAVQLDGSIEPQYRDKVCKLRKLGKWEPRFARRVARPAPHAGNAERQRLRSSWRAAEKELEKEKEEMIGKLKNLGNSLLGKVGLSLDNFKVNKDHATGSYNIQFQS